VEREIVIVDAKATDALKLSHRVQVGIYALLLEALIPTLDLKDKSPIRVSATGGVWLRYVGQPKDLRLWLNSFPLSQWRDQLSTFSAHSRKEIFKRVFIFDREIYSYDEPLQIEFYPMAFGEAV